MKVVLVSPPSPYLADDRAQAPMGLLYLAASLEKHGYDVSIIDLAGDPCWRGKILDLSAEVIGVSCTTPNVPIVQEIFQMAPHNSLKIAGGAHPTFLPEESLNILGCDVVVRGEGEQILPQILRDYQQHGKVKQVYEGGLVDLDAIPFPARHLVDLKTYNPEMEGEGIARIWSSRGCNRRCAFCAKLTGNRVRFRSEDSFMEELRILVNHYGFKNIIFMDDNFCLSKSRTTRVCKRIIKEKMDINIRICPRADSVSPQLLKLLSKAGVTETSFGVESGSQTMLNWMQKDTMVDVMKKAIRDAKAEGILVKIYLIVCFPFENNETIEETKRFVLETEPDKWLLQTFIPYPQTDVWRFPAKYGVTWISQDYSQFYTVGEGGAGGVVFETKTMSKQKIQEMHDDLYEFLMEYKPMRRA